jgi:hypothetical protein
MIKLNQILGSKICPRIPEDAQKPGLVLLLGFWATVLTVLFPKKIAVALA